MENKTVAGEINDTVPVELPAPNGWKKRFTPRKSGTPRRNDIVFVSPNGNEIKNKRQLEKYLKSHPGGPPASEFDWGTGDTPRRSSRLGDKSKATETLESDTPSKRRRKSSSKKGAKEDGGEQETEDPIEKETKGSDEPALPDAEDLEVQEAEIASKKVLIDGANIMDEEMKTNDGEIAPEEPPASEDKMEIVQEKEETMDEGNMETMENQEAEDKPLDNSPKTNNKSLLLNVLEENKCESKPAGTDVSSYSAELSKATSASQEESAEEAPAAADALNVLEENKTESKPAGTDASSHSAELSKATSASQELSAEEAPTTVDALNVLEENKIESKPAGIDVSSHSAELKKAASSQEESAEEAPTTADALNVLEEIKLESKLAGADASSHSAELCKATSVCQEESAEEAPTAAEALNVLEENKIESKLAGADASSHSAEFSKETSVSQKEALAAADALVQNSNNAKVDENEQIDREIPIDGINGTEAAATGVTNSVENNSVQQEATIVDQVTSS